MENQPVQQEASCIEQGQVTSAQLVQDNTAVHKVTKTVTKAVRQKQVITIENEDYKQQINNDQRKFLDLEEELKTTRSKLGTLVGANTEEKTDVLKHQEGNQIGIVLSERILFGLCM